MNKPFSLLCAVSSLLITPLAVAAEDSDPAAEKKIFIAVKTDNSELARTDISHLGIGDAETVYTDSGKTVDLLRTEDGVEVYVDGELMATGPHGDAEPGVAHKRIQIICNGEDEGSDCEDLALLEHGDIDLEALGAEGHGVIVIRDGDTEAEHGITIGEDVDVHAEGEGKVIVIRKKAEEI